MRRGRKGGAFVCGEVKETGLVEGGAENMGNHPSQKQVERTWKMEMAAGTKLKRVKGERRGSEFQ